MLWWKTDQEENAESATPSKKRSEMCQSESVGRNCEMIINIVHFFLPQANVVR
jgi:hypothetical protein